MNSSAMKKCFLLLTILLSGLFTLAQEEFRPGFVILKAGDTLQGFIKYQVDRVNSRECLFKKQADGEITIYNPSELSAYRITDSKYFVSREITLDSIKQSRFIEYLIDGIVDAYFFRDETGEHFLMDAGEGRLVELKNVNRIVKSGGSNYAAEVPEYVGVMKYIFRESPEIGSKVESLSLSRKSLIKISKEYHEEVCTDKECIVFEKQMKKTTLQLGILAGVGFVFTKAINIEPSYIYYYLYGCKFQTQPSWRGGIYAKVNFPNFDENLFLEHHAIIYNFSINTHNEFFPEPGYTAIHDVQSKRLLLQNLISVKYVLKNGKISPYLESGVFHNLLLKENYRRDTFIHSIYGTAAQSHFDSPFPTQEFGLMAGIGCRFRLKGNERLALGLSYQRNASYSSLISWNQFSLGLKLPLIW